MLRKWVLVKAYQLLVEDVEVCSSFKWAKERFREYTGMGYDECQEWKETDEYDAMWDYDQTKIFEVETREQASKIAHEIIDLVECRLRELYPDIDLMASQLEGNTLLYGEDYYDLENEIAELLEG